MTIVPAFIEETFPLRIARGATCTLVSRTRVTGKAGREARNTTWTDPLRVWDAARGIREKADLEEFINFLLVVGHRRTGFRFRDYSDFEAYDQEAVVVPGTNTFQLTKTYRVGAHSYTRTITKPTLGTIELWLNGRTVQFVSAGQSGFDAPLWGEAEFGVGEATAAATLDYTTGLGTIDRDFIEGDVLTWTGEFDVPARFDSDEISLTMITLDAVEYGAVPIREYRPRG